MIAKRVPPPLKRRRMPLTHYGKAKQAQARDGIDAQRLDNDIAEAAKLIGPRADRVQIRAAINLLLRIAPELEKLKELPSPAEVRVALEGYANSLEKVRYAAQGVPEPLRGLLPASEPIKKQEEGVLRLRGALVVQGGEHAARSAQARRRRSRARSFDKSR
jgi:hypothetical protein